MNKKLQAHLSILTANLIYGANFTIAKEVMPLYIKPFGFILIRVIGASLFYWLVSSFFAKEKIDRKDIFRLAMLGLFGVAINQLLFFKGLNLTTPINASIMMITTPILVLIIANFVSKEKITSTKLIGIILGFSGAISLLLLKSDFTIGSGTMEGDVCILINAASFSVYLVYAKSLMQKYNTFTIVKWVFLFGLIYVLPFGYNEAVSVSWASLPSYIWLCLLFVIIATTCFAYVLNTYALKELSSSIVSAYIYLQPLLATLIAIGFGKDKLDGIKILSALLIFFGVYLVSKPMSIKN